MNSVGDAIEALIWAVIVLLIVAAPLALWKLIEIGLYLYEHVGVSWK